MTKKTNIGLGDQQKALYEWAQDTFFENGGEVSRFLHFIKQEGREPIEVISYTDFLVLKEKFKPDLKEEFEAWILIHL